jgi:hypothetical protein
MTAPPVKKTVLNCRNKNRYPDECTARAAGMRSIEIHKNAKRLYVYPCPECRGYHLTKVWHALAQMVTADNPVHEGTRR